MSTDPTDNKTQQKGHIRNLFVSKAWYALVVSGAVLFLLSFFFPLLFDVAGIFVVLVVLLTLIDYALLFFIRGGLQGSRLMAPRFSLGDENTVTLSLANTFPYKAYLTLIDELPVQFQERNFRLQLSIGFRSRESISHQLKPLTRGVFEFGYVIAFVKTPLRLLQRRIYVAEPASVKVYPSFQQLKKYQLLATSSTAMTGVKKVRRLGHSMEFEKIKDYVQGDDIRTINWKATARRNDLMVNTYTDARQQQIYCMIDKGRAMKMPFEGMTLLDYAINASLALLNVALLRQDKAGLVTFAQAVDDVVVADRRNGQITMLIDALYKQQTDYKESDYQSLWSTVHRKLSHRSLLLLFTNFETFSSLERQLPYLRHIASRHLLCVVFFENTLLRDIQETQPDTIEGIYIKTIAERFSYEKKQIVKELRRHGILSILTTPANLSVDVINKYLELKARQMV